MMIIGDDRVSIKGFKHLRPGAEVAVRHSERFGRGVSWALHTISEIDLIAGVIRLSGTLREFGLDGYERGGTDGEPRQRLLAPVPDEARRFVWRQSAKGRLETLLYNWPNVDDRLIAALIETLDAH